MNLGDLVKLYGAPTRPPPQPPIHQIHTRAPPPNVVGNFHSPHNDFGRGNRGRRGSFRGRGNSRGRGGGDSRGGGRDGRGAFRGRSGDFASRGRGSGHGRADPDLALPWHVTQHLARAQALDSEQYRRERAQRWPSRARVTALRTSFAERGARGELLVVPSISLADLDDRGARAVSKRARGRHGTGAASPDDAMMRSLLSGTVRKERQAILQCVHYLVHLHRRHGSSVSAPPQ